MDASSEIKNRYFALIVTIGLHAILFLLFLLIVFKPQQNIIKGMVAAPENYIGLGLSQESNLSTDRSASSVSQNNADIASSITDHNETVLSAGTYSETVKQNNISNEQPEEDLKNALIRFGKIKNENNSNSVPGELKGDGNNKPKQADLPSTISSQISLSGRKAIKIPEAIKDFKEEGKVVVEIIVDEMGNVISATPGQRGSTTTSALLYEKAKAVVLQAKFSPSRDGTKEQRGTYTLVFALQ